MPTVRQAPTPAPVTGGPYRTSEQCTSQAESDRTESEPESPGPIGRTVHGPGSRGPESVCPRRTNKVTLLANKGQ
eukprot:656331-Hanusia_phi.AAC.1